MTTRRILITGGAGFIGYYLAAELVQDPVNELVLVDNLSRGRIDDEFEQLKQRPNVRFINGDLAKPETYETIGKGFHEVYHLAAIIGVEHVLKRPHEVLRVNALSTLLLLDWFIKGGGDKILFSSTSEAYAWTQQFYSLPVPTPEEVPLALTELANPRSSYAGSKIFGELSVTQFCTQYQKPFVIVRFHNVYGPRMGNEHVIPQLFDRARRGQKPLVVYSPSHRRAFCYVSDAISAVIASMRNQNADGQTFNIGNSTEEVSIEEIAMRILKQMKIDGTIERKEAANDPIARRSPDISKATTILGYRPLISLDRGLELTLDWYGKGKVK